MSCEQNQLNQYCGEDAPVLRALGNPEESTVRTPSVDQSPKMPQTTGKTFHSEAVYDNCDNDPRLVGYVMEARTHSRRDASQAHGILKVEMPVKTSENMIRRTVFKYAVKGWD